MPKVPGNPHPPISNITINQNGVLKLLKQLNPAKACGSDSITTATLKNCGDVLAPALSTIFQRCLDSGDLPQDWFDSNVSCVFKKGDRNLPENYRLISLTSVPCKILEHIICHPLLSHFEQQNTLTHRNHGFRCGFSCETQLLIRTHMVSSPRLTLENR